MKKNTKILIGISGGIDSAVATFLLKNKGFNVEAVFFILNNNYRENLNKSKKICNLLGIKLLKIDLREEFKNKITDYFIKSYQIGETPNPCIFCNQKIKFFYLYKLANKIKADFIATGHYAGIKNEFIVKGKDRKKDQSYFLYRLPNKFLNKTIFPLANCKKKDIINIARKNFLGKIDFGQESQDICFFSKNDSLKKFLKKYLSFKEGEIQDEFGNKIGRHNGISFYTIGQRKGLNLSGGPFFVIKKDLEKNILLVSKNKNHILLKKRKILLKDVLWTESEPSIEKEYDIKIRYSNKGKKGYIVKNKKGGWEVIFRDYVWAFAKGQSAVIYDDEKVVGGGIIK